MNVHARVRVQRFASWWLHVFRAIEEGGYAFQYSDHAVLGLSRWAKSGAPLSHLPRYVRAQWIAERDRRRRIRARYRYLLRTTR